MINYLIKHNYFNYIDKKLDLIWRRPSLNELASIIFHMKLTHLGSEASIYQCDSDSINKVLLFAELIISKIEKLIYFFDSINVRD